MNDWIDLPIISALDYFQGVLAFFFKIALAYGNFMGLLGLIWTSIKLVNSRISVRSAWWDALSKWFVFITLLNLYVPITAGIAEIANKVGVNAGNGKNTIISNFTSLKSRIEAELKLQEKWANGFADVINSETGIALDYIEPGESVEEYLGKTLDAIYAANYKWESRAQKKAAQKKIEAYLQTVPDNENSVWGEQTLQALNSILITKDSSGNAKSDLTGAYVVEKPELNIWLRDSENKATNYFSSSAIMRIGVLTSRIIWEKSQMTIHDELTSDGEKKSWGEKVTGFSWQRLWKSILAGILAISVLFAVAFATIQYTMCILEYIIVQGIGAAFIPLYLFDGTKDIPKKLVPVFTGFIIKIIVMTICLMFVINLYLTYAAEAISPTSGSIGLESFAEGLFIIILSFILTSNAPKIAMTLLTGQPQLSMGEFMQAAGTLAMGAAVGKNLAATAVSPGTALAKQKAHEWGERQGASRSARQKQEAKMKSDFAKDHGIDTSTKEGRRNLDKKWDVYRNSDDRKDIIDDKINTAGKSAAEETRAMQQTEHAKNGGALGGAGRLFAHYTGAAANLKQTLLQGLAYNIPQSNLDINRIGENSLVGGMPANLPPADDENIKKEDTRNRVTDSDSIKGTGGERQVK